MITKFGVGLSVSVPQTRRETRESSGQCVCVSVCLSHTHRSVTQAGKEGLFCTEDDNRLLYEHFGCSELYQMYVISFRSVCVCVCESKGMSGFIESPGPGLL